MSKVISEVATATKTSVRETLTAAIKKCKLVSIDGISYFGELTKDDTGAATLTNAIPCGESISETIKAWIKTNTLNNLETLEISGNVSFVSKNFTEDQMDEAELVIITAARATVNALPNLINSAI